MSNWYYDKEDLKDTPSIRDGLDIETERRYRKEGARFIMECGVSMGLGHNTMATGVVFFHRFYMFRSFKLFPRYVTACSCLFLAGKVEETPKKCKDIIHTARTMLSDQKFMSFGRHPKEEVMTLERILLQTIKFDLQVEHPYGFLVKYAKCLEGDQLKLQKMVQMAWNFANDSFSTTVCLQWEPEIVAAALIHLACKISKLTVSKWIGKQSEHFHWWDMFFANATVEIFEEICHQVLDLYQRANSSNVESPPQLPSSKSSPPPKRTEMPSTFKYSPVCNVTMPTIDEKLGSMSIKPIPQSITTANVNYACPPAYGTMLPQLKNTLPQSPINQTMKSYSVHAPRASALNAEGPPQLSPSKSSPPPKRGKMSSTVKSSPQQSITTDNVNYSCPPGYGTMFAQFKKPPPTINQTMKSYSVHAPQANSSNAEGPPRPPPSKSSPPSKRTKMSSTVKSCPVSTVTEPTIDEKLGSMSIKPTALTTTDNVNYAYPLAYGTIFTDFKIPPPPLINQTMKSYSLSTPPRPHVPRPLIPILIPPPSLINQTKVHAPPTPIPPRNHRPPNPLQQWHPRGYFQRR